MLPLPRRGARRRPALPLLCLLLLTACGGQPRADRLAAGGPAPAESSGSASQHADLPAYCSTRDGSRDAPFWRLVEASCERATDGDEAQAAALKSILRDLPAAEVAEFHRTFVRMNRQLSTAEFRSVADEACLPGLGLGEDLGLDFRSWVIAHGQLVYEWVAEDAQRLLEFPDLEEGCGMGELFGYAALDVHRRKTGRSAAAAGLPLL